MVHRRCAQLLKSEAEADDATQEVFVRVVRRHQADGIVLHKPVSYLWKIATHVCLNRLRSRRRRPEDATAPKTSSTASPLSTTAWAKAASAAPSIASLPTSP